MTLPSPSFYHSLTLDDIFQVWWGGRPVAHGHHWRSSPQKSPRSELDITSGLHIYNALPSHFFSVVTLLLCDTASQCCARGRYLIYKAGRRRSGEGMGIRMVSGGEGGPDGAREVRRHALSLCCGQSHCSCFCVLCTTVTSPPRPRSSHGHHHDHDDHSCHGGVHRDIICTIYNVYTAVHDSCGHHDDDRVMTVDVTVTSRLCTTRRSSCSVTVHNTERGRASSIPLHHLALLLHRYR